LTDRTRISSGTKWEPRIGRVHGEYFKDIKPVATMVEVTRLINPQMILEIEVEAILNPLNKEGN
jgi:enamine deaminase RidA (YjgF/YER057c/UK114 family)